MSIRGTPRSCIRHIAFAMGGILAASNLGCSLLFSVSDYDSVPADASATPDATTDNPRPACTDTRPIFRVRNPANGDTLYTMTQSEVDSAKAKFGYTDDHGIAFRGYPIASERSAAVYRLSNPTTSQHFWTMDPAERDSAAVSGNFSRSEGIGMYAVPPPGLCGMPVYRMQHLGSYILTISESERQQLETSGWHNDGIKFYAAPP